jgi:hypothetical protein
MGNKAILLRPYSSAYEVLLTHMWVWMCGCAGLVGIAFGLTGGVIFTLAKLREMSLAIEVCWRACEIVITCFEVVSGSVR